MSTSDEFPVLLTVEFSETDSHYLVEFSICDFHAEHVSVSTWQDCLVIDIESNHDCTQSYCPSAEISRGYRRVVPLDFDIAEEDLTAVAVVDNGDLLIEINKTSVANRSSNFISGNH